MSFGAALVLAQRNSRPDHPWRCFVIAEPASQQSILRLQFAPDSRRYAPDQFRLQKSWCRKRDSNPLPRHYELTSYSKYIHEND
jgi:hypothetical protein